MSKHYRGQSVACQIVNGGGGMQGSDYLGLTSEVIAASRAAHWTTRRPVRSYRAWQRLAYEIGVTIGSLMVKVVPWSSWLSQAIEPPCSLIAR